MAAVNSFSKIPVTVVTGFLGSGKTTLVNYILSEKHGKRIAVIENEFGEIGIDDALVLQAEEEVFEMNNGCICCTVRGDLIRILNKLAKKKDKFDYVIIETTGLADPAPVVQTFFVDDVLKEQYVLDAVVTVVDGKHIVQHLDEEKPEGAENESVEQIAFADIVILNKLDLIEEKEKLDIIARIKAINKPASILECQYARVDLDKIVGIKAFDLDKVLELEPDFLEDNEHEHDTSVTSVGITAEGSCNMKKLDNWLNELVKTKGSDLFRSKGILSVDGTDEKFVFQGVHMLLQMNSSSDGSGIKPWRSDEKRVNKLVFIGKNLDRDALNNSFKACLT